MEAQSFIASQMAPEACLCRQKGGSKAGLKSQQRVYQGRSPASLAMKKQIEQEVSKVGVQVCRTAIPALQSHKHEGLYLRKGKACEQETSGPVAGILEKRGPHMKGA